jgi:hypothetical protein
VLYGSLVPVDRKRGSDHIEESFCSVCTGGGLAELEKVKRTGKAYVKVAGECCLPTSYLLTGDSRWD